MRKYPQAAPGEARITERTPTELVHEKVEDIVYSGAEFSKAL